MPTFETKVEMLFDKMVELLLKKRADYGDNFEKSTDKFGLMSPLIRMQDKLNRLTNLVKNGTMPQNESIEDTFKDLLGYSALSLIWLKDQDDTVCKHMFSIEDDKCVYCGYVIPK